MDEGIGPYGNVDPYDELGLLEQINKLNLIILGKEIQIENLKLDVSLLQLSNSMMIAANTLIKLQLETNHGLYEKTQQQYSLEN